MNIVPLHPQDQSEAVDIFSQAFHDDPVMNWISDKPEFVRRLFELTLPVFLPHGLSYKVESGKGAAAWLGPGDQLSWPMNLSNYISVFRELGLGGMLRLAKCGIQTEKTHPKEPHYYLFAIGALSDCRGQGVGSKLIAHVLRRCDEEGMPAYLENSKQQNLVFYQGHGFEVIKQVRFAKGAPPVWLMWRKPICKHIRD